MVFTYTMSCSAPSRVSASTPTIGVNARLSTSLGERLP